MAAISITAANVIASAAATIRRDYLFGATVTAGQLVYLNASSQWALVDTDGNLGTGINDLRGIALDGGALNQPAAVCTNDPSFTPGGTLVNGLTVYGFTTPGSISSTDVPTTGQYPVIVGIPKSTSVLNLTIFASGVVI